MLPPFPGVLKQLRRELNHLYTEPFHPGDAGLFCREHALHLHGVASALGHGAEICTGRFGLRVPGQLTNAMTNSDGDHAWCRIDEITPVDLSLTPRTWPVKRPDVALVYGFDPAFLAGFEIQYAYQLSAEELDRRLAEGKADLLVYSENAVESRDAATLPRIRSRSFGRPRTVGARCRRSLATTSFSRLRCTA